MFIIHEERFKIKPEVIILSLFYRKREFFSVPVYKNGQLFFTNIVSVIKNVLYYVAVYGDYFVSAFYTGFLRRRITFNILDTYHKKYP